MSRLFRIACGVCSALLVLGSSATATEPENAPNSPVCETASSGLMTFSTEDRLLRLAITFVQADAAVIPTVVRFINANGMVIKTQRAELRDNRPVIVELTRNDIGEQPDLLVRVEVSQRLPERRANGYPIVTTLQPIARDGSARFLSTWTTPGSPGSLIPGGPIVLKACLVPPGDDPSDSR